MANSKGPSTIRNMMYNGKNPLLPPKSPFPSISPSYAEYIPTSAIGPKALPKPRGGSPHHQRTSSESFLIEEQPSWLDELLDEPETPVRKGGHRRSSSDSFAYIDTANAGNINYTAQDDNKFKSMIPLPSWGSQDFDFHRDMRQSSFYLDSNPSVRTKNKPWDTPINSIAPPRGLPSRDVTGIQNTGSVNSSQDAERNPTSSAQKSDVESSPLDPKGSIEKIDSPHVKNLASETDTKRAKQQFAQRSRVRKLQYIAELERHVQALQLQAEGSEISAELEFLNQKNLILSLENKALKQRLESLSQEQLIKYFEHEVLEREAGRLRSLYQQQKQPAPTQAQQISSSHRRAKSRDLDQQLANLSLKHKEASSAHDSLSSQLHM
ncbi:Basic-leucine zipper transcription factor family protein [Perilla frutescens var. hirtella]|nr:Basic-leucine zipper transcription factor family protein [Perilla frutescens var. hirtella]KAH6805746.1 Basic-leucine zipper transcription factor family protein [Perilla frutescens var. frutescens]